MKQQKNNIFTSISDAIIEEVLFDSIIEIYLKKI